MRVKSHAGWFHMDDDDGQVRYVMEKLMVSDLGNGVSPRYGQRAIHTEAVLGQETVSHPSCSEADDQDCRGDDKADDSVRPLRRRAPQRRHRSAPTTRRRRQCVRECRRPLIPPSRCADRHVFSIRRRPGCFGSDYGCGHHEAQLSDLLRLDHAFNGLVASEGSRSEDQRALREGALSQYANRVEVTS